MGNYYLQDSMKLEQERRKRLEQRLQEFEERRGNFRQFIIDNVNKIHRQHVVFTDMREAQAKGREVMLGLIVAMREMRQRYVHMHRFGPKYDRFSTFTSLSFSLSLSHVFRHKGDDARGGGTCPAAGSGWGVGGGM